MSKQATHSAFPGLNGLSLEVGPLSNGWKDLTSGNAFDIRFPPPSDNYLSPQNIGALTDDVFNDSLPTKLLGGDLLKGIMSLGDDSNDGEDTFPKSSSSTSTSGALGQGFDNFWKNGASSANSEASLLRGCMTNSSTKPTGDYPSAFAHFSNNEGLGFLRRSSSFKDEQVTSTSGGNESSRTSSDPESPGGAEANPGSSSSDIAAPPSSQGSMGFIERAQLINQRINSNEGWGKKPIRQDTPWAVEGSMYGSRRDETEANQPQPQAQQPETTGPFWDQTARIANCSDSDRNFGVWSEPGRTSGSSGLSGLASTGVGVWKNNLGAKRVETPSGQPSWPPNPADPMAVLAACVANKLEDPAAKAPKWTSQPLLNSLSMASQLPGPQSVWDDIGKSNTNNQAYTPWNSGQRMMGNAPADGTTTDPNTILQLLAFTGSQKGLQGNEQKNDIFNNANKPYGFEGPRGRPLFPQKAHNPTPSPLPTQFPSFSFNNQPPQSRMDFSGQQLLPPNLYPGSAGQNNMFLANQQQENAQKLLLHLMQQQQQQQHQQQQHQGNNAELMMMMMADQSKLVPGMDKEVVLAHLLNNMRLEGKKDMPWHMQYQQPAAEIGNVWSGQPMGHVTQMMDDPSNLFMGGANNALFNSRLNSWQHNKQVPNTANLSYNWLLIKQFSGDIASLQLICQQNKAVVQFCSVNSNSVLIYFNSTDDSMKAKANLAMKNVPCDLLDNNTASQKLQEGIWTKMATIQHPSFLPMQGGNLPWGAGARF